MKATRLNRPTAVVIFVMAALLAAGAAFALTPNPNSAVVHTRIFNDCAISVLSVVNAYPALITIDDDMDPLCLGFANRHNWSFSEDGFNPANFPNNSNFHFAANVVMTGDGFGEGGLRISPWWSPDVDGVFMLNDQSGEIAIFGGRLPFYSFTANHGITYTKGTVVLMEMTYHANGLSMASPATVEYEVTLGGTPYTSGPIPFDEGNPAEGHGSWGMLEPAWVGGWVQAYAGASNGGVVHIEWREIVFENLDPTAVQPTTWGRLKNLY